MKILLVAPHPFYQERGTPIAVDMLLQVLSGEGHQVDVCTFPEGEERAYPGVTIYRATPWGGVKQVGPGFSLKKLYTDLFLFRLVARMYRHGGYDVVHAVEEAGFLGLYLKMRFKARFIYDMDSLMSEQLVESRPWVSLLRGVFESLENRVVRQANVVAPMCEALAERVNDQGQDSVVVLKDVSLIRDDEPGSVKVENLRETCGFDGPLVMYIGNLEPYQGITLLLRSFAIAGNEAAAGLVIIGGKPEHIRQYRSLARELGISERICFTGPRPVAGLSGYLRQADILVSPRVQGSNTPMKIYSYLHSGVALLATDLPTHTQVLDSRIAILAPAEETQFGKALAGLLLDRELRVRTGRAAAEHAAREHSYESFRANVRELYSRL